MKTFRISVGNAPKLSDTTYAANYVLTMVGEPYLFRLREYWIEIGNDPEKIHTPAICSRLDSILDSRLPVAEIVKDLNLEFGAKVGPTIGTSLETFVDLWIMSTRYSRIRNSRALIAVRGYADGERSRWTDTLRSKYLYEHIAVLPPADPGNDVASEYRMAESTIEIQDRVYDNTTLPDLRAEFVKREIIARTLSMCGGYESDVRVIKGHTFATADQPQERKVQVFVYLFEK
ncbi:MAG TPA: hypothetical protein VGC13_27845 [Longimicrobium sp.]|jgi:hypothetical protein|uniref:hypothetical protein n=1 Tax=Longimicrobium sp. TaxID=2029185 RepID=UPI002ED969FD